MKSVIAACGNHCSVCPRMLPKTDAELKATAELWYKIGYRDQVVSNIVLSNSCHNFIHCIDNYLPIFPKPSIIKVR